MPYSACPRLCWDMYNKFALALDAGYWTSTSKEFLCLSHTRTFGMNLRGLPLPQEETGKCKVEGSSYHLLAKWPQFYFDVLLSAEPGILLHVDLCRCHLTPLPCTGHLLNPHIANIILIRKRGNQS